MSGNHRRQSITLTATTRDSRWVESRTNPRHAVSVGPANAAASVGLQCCANNRFLLFCFVSFDTHFAFLRLPKFCLMALFLSTHHSHRPQLPYSFTPGLFFTNISHRSLLFFFGTDSMNCRGSIRGDSVTSKPIRYYFSVFFSFLLFIYFLVSSGILKR